MGSEIETWLSVYNYKDLNYIPIPMQWWDSHVSITLELCGMKEIWREVLTQRHKAESDRWFRTSCFSFQMHIHANISHTYFIHASISHIYITHANISHTYITHTWRITYQSMVKGYLQEAHTYISHTWRITNQSMVKAPAPITTFPYLHGWSPTHPQLTFHTLVRPQTLCRWAEWHLSGRDVLAGDWNQ